MRSMALCSLLAISLAGCVHSASMTVGEQTYPARAADYAIDVYLPLEAPVVVHQTAGNAKLLSSLPASAITIGRVDTSGAPVASWASVIEEARRQARAMGGDAVVIKQWDMAVSDMAGYDYTAFGKNLSMTVVRYKP